MAETVPTADQAAHDDAVEIEQIRALAGIFRGILAAALAAAIAGTFVLGIGGRVVMRVAAVLNPDATGSSTENGEVIGAITFAGTTALVFFGGLLIGLMASVIWVTVAPWIPGSGVRRALLAAPVAIALSGFVIVDSDNQDFVVLRQDLVIVAMFLGIIGVFGFCLALMDERFRRRLPKPGIDPRRYAATTGLLVLIGAVLVLPLAIGAYFEEQACLCSVLPIPLAVPLLVTGGATVAWWIQETRGLPRPTAPVRAVGSLALLAAVGLGTALVASEVASLPI